MRNPMFVYDEATADLVLDYCRQRLALDPVPLDFGGYATPFDHVLAGAIAPHGHDPREVLDLFVDHLATAVISCDSPRFLSFIPAAPTKASLLFDMVVSCSSLQGTSWLEAAGAVAAENQALAVLADMAGMAPGAGGCFVSGGSAANLSALMVARDTASRFAHRGGGGGGGGGGGPAARIACSEEAHSSIGKALRVLGMGTCLVPALDHRLTGDALDAALHAATDDEGPVVGVVATAGTTNAGIVDDLAGVAEVAARRHLWFHVDAAYGGGALFAPSARPLFAGIEHADSLVVDPHKWLFAPYDCAALLYRVPSLAKAVHTQDAAYLDVIHDAPLPIEGSEGQPAGRDAGPWNPSDYAFHLSRRSRGLPLWFSLAVHGTDAYRDAIEAVLDTTRRVARLVEATSYTELVMEPQLSIVLFRRQGWQRADYDGWSARLLAEQIAFVTPTTWEGEAAARFALLHPDTTLAIIEEILDTMA